MNGPYVAEPRTYYRRLPPVVVDCNVLAALLFSEPRREEAMRSLTGKYLYAPWLIDHELISVAMKKVNAGFAEDARLGIEDAHEWRITRRQPNVLAQFELARRENLSAYDAAYLQLAIELNVPLVTFDKALAAVSARVLAGR